MLKLDEKGVLIVVDYKMKILPKTACETKQKFFGKKGWTLHSTLIYTRKSDHQLNIQAYDHWSADTCQDAWFTAFSLYAVIESLKIKSNWVTFLSDNGSHYHNADLMLILGHWNEWSWPTEGEYAGFIQARAIPNIGRWNNFEPAKIAKFEKRFLEKPDPKVSDHSTPTFDWNAPLPNKSSM